MAQVLVNEASLQDIASAIREKTGGTETFLPSAMGAAIRAIGGGESKSATGTVAGSNSATFTVSGLSFKPKNVLVLSNNAKSNHIVMACKIANTTGITVDLSSSGTASSYVNKYLNWTMNDNGFTVTSTFSSNGTTTRFLSSDTYTWVATE